MHPFAGLPCKPTILDRPRKTISLVCIVFWVFFFILPPRFSCGAEKGIDSLQPYIERGGYALQIQENVVRSSHLEDHFIPASTIKVLTSLMALEIMGPVYRFVTEISLDRENNLYIKGEGDPYLVSETIGKIADLVKSKNITEINTLFLDDSAFALERLPEGSENTDNPYDAQSSAFAVNFNALPFKILKDGTVQSGERQTPYLPLMAEFAKYYTPGNFRVNVSSMPESMEYSNILRYSGELFAAIFTIKGITIKNGYSAAPVPRHARRIASYKSEKTVADMVSLSLKYSSNFIANQLFLSCGRRVYGFPATWAKAKRAAQIYIGLRLHLREGQIKMIDGSGLSMDNRITPAAMLTILNRFMPYVELMRKNNDIYIKSGTMTGVYCYAGYFHHDAELSPYVLFLNQKKNNRKKVLKLLHDEYLQLTGQPGPQPN